MKIFYFDLDGTLLNSEKVITARTMEALETWVADGNKIAISSGRPLNSILEVIHATGLDRWSVYAIAFNGALIYDVSNKKLLSKTALSTADMLSIADILSGMDLYSHYYDDTHILSPDASSAYFKTGQSTEAVRGELTFYTRNVHLPYHLLTDYPGISPAPSCKMLCIDLNGEKLSDAASAIEAAGEGRIRCVRSNPWYLEIFPIEAGKGAAVVALADILGIPTENTLAAGDEQNDISMITAAGVGVAMKNGNPLAMEAADIVTDEDNDHDGLAPIILRYSKSF